MLAINEPIILTSYRGGCLLLEAELSDLVCREAPRLIAQLEEYPEPLYYKEFASQGRAKHQVRGQGAGNHCALTTFLGEAYEHICRD